jgi:pyruvate kinase
MRALVTPHTRSSDAAAAQERASLAAVARELLRLEQIISEFEVEMRASIERVPAEHRESARNLAHYVALRQHDLRELQLELAQLGLSSLGRSESCVRRSLLEASRRAHEALALRGDERAVHELARLDLALDEAFDWQTAMHYLHAHTREILGPRPDDRHISIMVTAPSAKEADAAWMAKMLREGMNVLRINCAHEDAERWDAMIRALAEARRETGRECRVLMDLAGPKIRTGTITGPRVTTWKPTRDNMGKVIAPARVVVRRASALRGDGGPAALSLTRRSPRCSAVTRCASGTRAASIVRSPSRTSGRARSSPTPSSARTFSTRRGLRSYGGTRGSRA